MEDVEDIEDLDDVEDLETFADVQTTIQRWHTFIITLYNSLGKVTLGLSFELHLQSGQSGECKLQSCIGIVIRLVHFFESDHFPSPWAPEGSTKVHGLQEAF